MFISYYELITNVIFTPSQVIYISQMLRWNILSWFMVLWYNIGHVYIDDYLIVAEIMCKNIKDNQFSIVESKLHALN
jgi:hypothetical protein